MNFVYKKSLNFTDNKLKNSLQRAFFDQNKKIFESQKNLLNRFNSTKINLEIFPQASRKNFFL